MATLETLIVSIISEGRAASLGEAAAKPVAAPSTNAVVLVGAEPGAQAPEPAYTPVLGCKHESHQPRLTPTSLMNAVSAEVAFTVHSVFIGLAVGVAADSELTSLLVALVFHQFFEGISLGARLFEAPLSGLADAAFTLVYSVSAPAGIAAGIGLVSGSLLSAPVSYLYAQGFFDAICAGLLLHIGFSMLLIDFPQDLATVSKGANKVVGKVAIIASLWVGGGVMAFLGKYL